MSTDTEVVISAIVVILAIAALALFAYVQHAHTHKRLAALKDKTDVIHDDVREHRAETDGIRKKLEHHAAESEMAEKTLRSTRGYMATLSAHLIQLINYFRKDKNEGP